MPALACVALAACGSSSTPKSASAAGAPTPTGSSQSSTPSSTPPSGSTSPQGSSGANNGPGGAAPGTSTPLARASSFTTCMRAHGVKLPVPTPSAAGGATLDYSHVNTTSKRYKTALAACARKLLGSLHIGKQKLRGIHLKGIHIKGLKLKGIHVGRIELPGLKGLKLGGLNVPAPHISTPPPGGGASATGEPEVSPK